MIAQALVALASSSSTWLRADLAREIAARLPAEDAGSATEVTRVIDELSERAAARGVELHLPAALASPAGGTMSQSVRLTSALRRGATVDSAEHARREESTQACPDPTRISFAEVRVTFGPGCDASRRTGCEDDADFKTATRRITDWAASTNLRRTRRFGISSGERNPTDVTVRVFLVDDHEVVRRGLRDLIEAEPGLIVVGEAASTQEALSLLPSTDPDVAVLDVRLPDGDGVELCRELRARGERPAVLMLTSFEDDDALMNAVMAGAAGYVLKQIRGTDLIEAIKLVASGLSLLDPAVRERAFARLVEISQEAVRKKKDFAILTPQERRILDLIAEGCTNRQIAARMFLSEKTVKNYVSNLLRKLGMRGRTEAAVYATNAAAGRTEDSLPNRVGRPAPGARPRPIAGGPTSAYDPQSGAKSTQAPL